MPAETNKLDLVNPNPEQIDRLILLGNHLPTPNYLNLFLDAFEFVISALLYLVGFSRSRRFLVARYGFHLSLMSTNEPFSSSWNDKGSHGPFHPVILQALMGLDRNVDAGKKKVGCTAGCAICGLARCTRATPEVFPSRPCWRLDAGCWKSQ